MEAVVFSELQMEDVTKAWKQNGPGEVALEASSWIIQLFKLFQLIGVPT